MIGKTLLTPLLLGLAALPFSSEASVEVRCEACSPQRIDALRSTTQAYLRFYQPYFSVDLEALPLLIQVSHSEEEIWKTEAKRIQLSFDPSRTPEWIVDGILVHELGHWILDHDPMNPFSELMALIKSDADLDSEDTHWWNEGEGEKEDGPHRGPIRELREKNRKHSLQLSACTDQSEFSEFMRQYFALDEFTADLLAVAFFGDAEAMRKVSESKGSKNAEFRSFSKVLPNDQSTFDRITDEFGYVDTHGLLSPSRSAIGRDFSSGIAARSPRRASAAISFSRRAQGLFFRELQGCRIEESQRLNHLILSLLN